MNKSVFIVAAERSGDELGAHLATSLRTKSPKIELSGIGGGRMVAQGLKSDLDIAPLAILGFVEGLKALPTVRKLVRQAVDIILPQNPDMVVLIDSWGFMMRVAQALRKAGYKGQLVKYVAPQVWATREGRSKILADGVDHLLTIHSFDAPYFEKHGLSVTFVGNPMFDTDLRGGNRTEMRKHLGAKDTDIVISIFLGSRPAEISRLSQPFADAIQHLSSEYPHIKFVTIISDSLRDQADTLKSDYPGFHKVVFLSEKNKRDVFAAADIALACSGTVTTQLARSGIPTIVAYKINMLTYYAMRAMYKQNHVSLINISAGRELMAERLQQDCTGEKLVEALMPYIKDATLREDRGNELIEQAAIMQGKGGSASDQAASKIISLLSS